jgi:hypothetical protein
VTPDVLFLPSAGRHGPIYLAHNKEYEIFHKDLKGDLLRVIERPHKNAKLSREGRRSLLAKFKGAIFRRSRPPFPTSSFSECTEIIGLRTFREFSNESWLIRLKNQKGRYKA